MQVPYYSLHNHPSNGILSPEDIQQLIKRPQMQGIGAVGNAGALFTCEKVFGYSQKNAEGWFKALKKKYPLYKGESGKIEDALAQRIAFAEELRRDGAKYGSYFQDNPPTPEEIAKWRADLTRGWPYTEDDPEPDFFDWTPDPDRSATTDSIYLLKATGNWTAEDERIAFDPSKPPPRPLAELEAEHDAFLKELFKKAKPL